MTNIIVKRAALLALAAFAVPAAAKPTVEQVQLRVDYADLNLQTAAGAVALRHRIRTGIRETCVTLGYRRLSDLRRESDCRRSMAANADMKLAGLIAKDKAVKVAGR
ncbi:MAG: hypothetical protein JWR77_661 [Rhizorhabdus sp.]|nr:hypothetical protein [Rhizorhabdus sp.]